MSVLPAYSRKKTNKHQDDIVIEFYSKSQHTFRFIHVLSEILMQMTLSTYNETADDTRLSSEKNVKCSQSEKEEY